MSPSRLVCAVIGFIAFFSTVQSQQPILLLPNTVVHQPSLTVRQALLQIVVCPSDRTLNVSFQTNGPASPVPVLSVQTQHIIGVEAQATAYLVFLGDSNNAALALILGLLTLSLSFRCGLTGPEATTTASFAIDVTPHPLDALPVEPIRINRTVPVGESILQLRLEFTRSNVSYSVYYKYNYIV